MYWDFAPLRMTSILGIGSKEGTGKVISKVGEQRRRLPTAKAGDNLLAALRAQSTQQFDSPSSVHASHPPTCPYFIIKL